MAMNGDQLGIAIANAIMNASAPDAVKAQVIELWKKVGREIVNHIKTYGVVQVDTDTGTGRVQ